MLLRCRRCWYSKKNGNFGVVHCAQKQACWQRRRGECCVCILWFKLMRRARPRCVADMSLSLSSRRRPSSIGSKLPPARGMGSHPIPSDTYRRLLGSSLGMRVRLFGCLRRPTCEFFVGGVVPVSDSTMLSRAPLAIVLLFTLRQYFYYHYYYAHANIYIYIYI